VLGLPMFCGPSNQSLMLSASCSRKSSSASSMARRGDLLVHRRFVPGRSLPVRYRRGVYIKGTQKLDATTASEKDSKRVRPHPAPSMRSKGHVEHLHRGVSARACAAVLQSVFLIGYLIGIASSGLFQAIFMANAGGAWTTPEIVSRWTCARRALNCTPPPSWRHRGRSVKTPHPWR